MAAIEIGGPVNWQARLDAITDEHISAVRGLENQLDEIDIQVREAFDRAIDQLVSAESAPNEPERSAAGALPDESGQQMPESFIAVRQQPVVRRPVAAAVNGYVLPSDWTDEDEARLEGYGPPKSWLV